MKTVTRLKTEHRQRGAVAITFALSLLLLMGFMALVFDLGRTYVVRTELQNAADAAALAGAKELNGRLAGVERARLTAQAIGRQNNTRFSFNGNVGIEITEDMIYVGSCPNDASGCEWTQASEITDATAANKTFLRIHIPSGGLATFFARVPTTLDGTGIQETRTYGLAVAGYYVREITPIGICALDSQKGGIRTTAAGDELTEFGYRRGVAYNIMELGPLGGSGQPYLLNPVDKWGSPACDPSHSSANYTAPFVCTGTSAAIGTVPGNAYGNTGYSAGPIEVALNSRFKVNACAPQDANIRQYAFDDPDSGYPHDWMNPDPDLPDPKKHNQTIRIERDPVTDLPYVPTPLTNQEYGVLWTYSRAVKAVGSPPYASPGAPFNLDQWPSLYPASSPPNLTADTSVYLTDTVSPYATSVDTTGGKPNRRVLNLAIVNCPGTGTGCNSTIPIVGIGKFFMQVEADLPKKLEAEFAGLIDPLPPPTEIRLYK